MALQIATAATVGFDIRAGQLHVLHMNKHIQIREVPDETHRALKARAAAEGMSMSDYLKRLIERDLKRPSWDEMVERLAALKPIKLAVPAADMVREERDRR